MKIGIIGFGVVGSATAKVFQKVHEVYIYDKFKKDYNSKENLKKLVINSEIIFLCVPTPMKQSGEIDLSIIHETLDTISQEIKKAKINSSEKIIAIRSTVVPGTCDELSKKYDFKFASNPEFLTEKNALKDMENTERVVIGSNDEDVSNRIKSSYSLIFPAAIYRLANTKTAEMIKYAANVALMAQIINANEIYQICQKLEINYEDVKNAVLDDKRIGTNISVPGPDNDFGFGGKCFPKDLLAITFKAEQSGYNSKFLKAIWETNEKVRTNKDWLKIPGTTSENKTIGKK